MFGGQEIPNSMARVNKKEEVVGPFFRDLELQVSLLRVCPIYLEWGDGKRRTNAIFSLFLVNIWAGEPP